mgnify:CR=1 FL=1
MKCRHVILALAFSAAATFGPAYGQTTQGQSVGAAIEQIASGLAGRIGFAAQEIGGDEVISFNGDESFAMASTYKVAIATTVLDRVDRGELSLDQLVEVPPDMYVTGVIALAETFPHPAPATTDNYTFIASSAASDVYKRQARQQKDSPLERQSNRSRQGLPGA